MRRFVDWCKQCSFYAAGVLVALLWAILLVHAYWPKEGPPKPVLVGRYLLIEFQGQSYRIPYSRLESIRAQVKGQRELFGRKPEVAFYDETNTVKMFQGTLEDFMAAIIDTIRIEEVEREPIDLAEIIPPAVMYSNGSTAGQPSRASDSKGE